MEGDGRSDGLSPERLAAAAVDLAPRLRAVPFDPTSINSPPWAPQFHFAALAQRLWRQRWLWALYQVEGVPDTVRQFMHWALAAATPPPGYALDAARHAVPPDAMDWKGAAAAYVAERPTPPDLHILWPLQAGGVVFRHTPTMLAGIVEFIPAEATTESTEPADWHPDLAMQELAHLAPGFTDRPPLRQETTLGGWLHYRPDGPAAAASPDVWPQRWRLAQTRLFLALSALRLAAPGLLTAPYSIFLPSPLFWGMHAVSAYAEPPHGMPFAGSIHRSSWPEGNDLPSALAEASSFLDDLLALPWLSEASLVEPGVTVNPGPMTAYVYRPVPYVPSSYLEFALFMLDVSYGRRLMETVVNLWAVMEALFLTPEGQQRGACQSVAKRAAALLGTTKTVEERREMRKAVERFSKLRAGLAHGRKGSPQLFPNEVAEFQELTRQSVAAMVRFAADWTRQGRDASDNAALVGELDRQADALDRRGRSL